MLNLRPRTRSIPSCDLPPLQNINSSHPMKELLLVFRGTSPSQPYPKDHSSWNIHSARKTNGTVNPRGTTLLVTQISSSKDTPWNVKQSSLVSQVRPRTLWDSASKNVSIKSRCTIQDTSGLFEPHLTRFILAFNTTSKASWTMLQHSSMEPTPDRKSSMYIFSGNSSTTRDVENKAKWDWTMAFKRKGLL